MTVQRLQRGLNDFAARRDVNALPELMDQLRIGQRPVACLGLQLVALDQRVEVVPFVLREQGARCTVHSTGARKVMPRRLNSFFRKP